MLCCYDFYWAMVQVKMIDWLIDWLVWKHRPEINLEEIPEPVVYRIYSLVQCYLFSPVPVWYILCLKRLQQSVKNQPTGSIFGPVLPFQFLSIVFTQIPCAKILLVFVISRTSNAMLCPIMFKLKLLNRVSSNAIIIPISSIWRLWAQLNELHCDRSSLTLKQWSTYGSLVYCITTIALNQPSIRESCERHQHKCSLCKQHNCIGKMARTTTRVPEHRSYSRTIYHHLKQT